MTDQEFADLNQMKQKMAQEKELLFSILQSLDRATPEELKYGGWRGMTNADAMRGAYQSCAARIEKLEEEYIKKYPD